MRHLFAIILTSVLFLGCAHVDANYPNQPPKQKPGWAGDTFEKRFENENVIIRVAKKPVPVEQFRQNQESLLAMKRNSLPQSEFEKYKANYQRKNPVSTIMKKDHSHDYFKVEIRYKTSSRLVLNQGFFLFHYNSEKGDRILSDEGVLIEKRGDRNGFLNGQNGPIIFGTFFNDRVSGDCDKAHVRVLAGRNFHEVSFDPSKLTLVD